MFVAFLPVHLIFNENSEYWSEARQSWQRPFHPDLLAPFVLGLLVIAWSLPWMMLDRCRLIPSDIRVEPKTGVKPLNELLVDADLLHKPDWPDPDKGYFKLLAACTLSVPLYLPTQLLFGPAMFALWMVLWRFTEVLFWTGLFFILWWMLLGFMRMHGFITDGKSGFVGRMMYQGGPLVVSWIVIVITLAYLYGVQYVSTVLEADWWLAMKYVAAAYLAVWLFEYWTNRRLSEAVLELIRPPTTSNELAAATPFDATRAMTPEQAAQPHFDILRSDRGKPSEELRGQGTWHREGQESKESVDISKLPNVRVQIHAGALFAAFDLDHPDDANRRAVYEKTELIETVIRRTGRAEGEYNLPALRNPIKYYSGVLDFVLVAALIMTVLWMYDHTRSGIVDAQRNATGDVSLSRQLFHEGKDRVILLAGSGGGTRTVLYTASVLEGLRRLDVLKEVVLTSGVSGGGASLAYFAANRNRLAEAEADTEAWNRFHTNMADPFISHVLEGASEFRIATGTPLGQLLAEDFERAFKDGGADSPVMGDVSHVAIWNTTLCGEFPPQGANDEKTRELNKDYVASRKEQASQLASRYHAGGRLIFSNLNTAFKAFQRQGFVDAPRENLRYVVVGDPGTELWKIAALNANFPPIFQNARVDLKVSDDVAERYWVTDGGAMDNRGLISLLYALRDTLQHACQQENVPRIPKIHIVVAEASAGGIDYSHDQGLKAIGAAKGMVANGLLETLVDEVAELEDELYKKNGTIKNYKFRKRIHYLTMPSVFRMRGGMGTHWIMHESVKFVDTNPPDKDDTRILSEAKGPNQDPKAERDSTAFHLDGSIVRQVIRNLHPQQMGDDYVWSSKTRHVNEFSQIPTPGQPSKLKRKEHNLTDGETDDLKRLKDWIENDYQGTHKKSWSRLIKAFRTPADASRSAKPEP